MMLITAMVDNINSGINEIEDGMEQGANLVKAAACHRLESFTDSSSSMGRGIKKSFKGYKKDAGRFARSVSEFIDVEDVLKTIHKAKNPEEYERRHHASSIIHTPIDWTKTPPPTFRKFTEDLSRAIEEDFEKDEKNSPDNKGESSKDTGKDIPKNKQKAGSKSIKVTLSPSPFLRTRDAEARNKEKTISDSGEDILVQKNGLQNLTINGDEESDVESNKQKHDIKNQNSSFIYQTNDLATIKVDIHIRQHKNHDQRICNTIDQFSTNLNKIYFPDDTWSPTASRTQCFSRNTIEFHNLKKCSGKNFEASSELYSSTRWKRSHSIPCEDSFSGMNCLTPRRSALQPVASLERGRYGWCPSTKEDQIETLRGRTFTE